MSPCRASGRCARPLTTSDQPHWQAAAEAVMMATEGTGPCAPRPGPLARCLAEEGQAHRDHPMKTVWIYVDTSKDARDGPSEGVREYVHCRPLA